MLLTGAELGEWAVCEAMVERTAGVAEAETGDRVEVAAYAEDEVDWRILAGNTRGVGWW